MSTPRSFLVVLTLAVSSCAEPMAPGMPDTLGPSAAGGHRVAGSGHVQQAAGLREFTFHALQHPDGAVSGSFKVVLPSGLFFEADVTCLAVEASTGWVAGTIRATNAAPVVVGSISMFYAVDGGEGDGAVDVVSTAAFNAPAGADVAFCADRPLVLPPLQVTDGNVHVH